MIGSISASAQAVKASLTGMNPTTIGINIYQGDDTIETLAASTTDFLVAAVWTRCSSRSGIRSHRIGERRCSSVVSGQISIGWHHERNIPRK
jgi:hypothetical protein